MTDPYQCRWCPFGAVVPARIAHRASLTWEDVAEAARWWNTRRPLTRQPADTGRGLAMEATRICTVEGCERPRKYRLLCKMHYRRLRATGTTDLAVRIRPLCQVDGCERPSRCNSYCNMHALRVAKQGHPGPPAAVKFATTMQSEDIIGRLAERTTVTAFGCFEWSGSKTPNGYGQIRWQGRSWVTHRAAWTELIGPLAAIAADAPRGDDETLDHLCLNPACWNPDHLEPVSRAENTRRAGGLVLAQEANRRRPLAQSCGHGHPFDESNTRVNADGSRCCRTCHRDNMRRRRAAMRPSAPEERP